MFLTSLRIKKESLKKNEVIDIKGLIGLYEASQLRVKKQETLAPKTFPDL